MSLTAWALALLLVAPLLLNRLAPAWSASRLVRLQRRLAGLQDRAIDLGPLRLIYSEGGQGEPLLLLHGLGAGRTSFESIAGRLADFNRLLIPDLPGFGQTGPTPDGDYSIAAQVAWIERWVTALGLERFHLGGNSMGGWIAAAYAARFPAKVTSLWLLAAAGTGEMLQTEAVMARQQSGAYLLLARNDAEFRALLRRIFYRPPFLPYCLRWLATREAAACFPLHAQIFDQLLLRGEQDRLEPWLPQLSAPTLLLWGAEDQVVPLGVLACFQRLLPSAQTVLLPAIGHVPQMEAPARVAADYRHFRAGLGH